MIKFLLKLLVALLIFFIQMNKLHGQQYIAISDSITTSIDSNKVNIKDRSYAKLINKEIGKKFWVEYQTTEDLRWYLNNGYQVIKTRINKGEFWRKMGNMVTDKDVVKLISDWILQLFNKTKKAENEEEGSNLGKAYDAPKKKQVNNNNST